MFTPDVLAKSGSEDGHQTALFAWANMARLFGFQAADDLLCYTEKGYAKTRYSDHEGVHELEMMFAIPNGGLRDKITAAKLKATGVKAGYPDIALDMPMGARCGLRIEMKRPASKGKPAGTMSDMQVEWQGRLNSRGYVAVTCVGWQDAAKVIKDYLQEKS